MRKSCVQFVHSASALCGRIHSLFAWLHAIHMYGGYYLAVIPRLLRTYPGLFYTAQTAQFTSVFRIVFPTIHTTNNNYNFLYIPI